MDIKYIELKVMVNLLRTSIAPQMITRLREIIDNYDIIHMHAPNPITNIALLLSKLKSEKTSITLA